MQLTCFQPTYTVFGFAYHSDTTGDYYGNILYCGWKTYSSDTAWVSVPAPATDTGTQYVTINSNSPSLVGNWSPTVYVYF